MADLSRRVGRTATRGQILLVTALVLGISFVALALILNSAIFTENLASRGDTTGANKVVTYHHNLQDGVGKVVAVENRNATTSDTHAAVLDRIEMGTTNASAVAVRRHAREGVVSNVSIVGHGNGSRIFQTDSSRNFSDGNSNDDWTVASGVDATRAFEMNVSQAALSSCGLFSDCFTMNITDGPDDWRVSITDTGTSGIEIHVDNESGVVGSCGPVDEPFVTVDVTAGTVNGTACSALNVSEAPSDSYSIEFNNSDEIEGTYSLVVDDETIAEPTVPPQFNTGSGPIVTPATYNLTLRYQYETSDLRVATDLRVAPGEPDGR